jgi:choline-sulfatase
VERPNVVVILSDEHTAAAAGWAGHPQVRTPNLDRLAAEGTSFDSAYTNSPMCVPLRLSLMSIHAVSTR